MRLLRLLAALVRAEAPPGGPVAPSERGRDPGERPLHDQLNPECAQLEREDENHAHGDQRACEAELPEARADLGDARTRSREVPGLRRRALWHRLRATVLHVAAVGAAIIDTGALAPIVADHRGVDLANLGGTSRVELATVLFYALAVVGLLFGLAAAASHALGDVRIPAYVPALAFAAVGYAVASLRAGEGTSAGERLLNIGISLALAWYGVRAHQRGGQEGKEAEPLEARATELEAGVRHARNRVDELEEMRLSRLRARMGYRRRFDAPETVVRSRRAAQVQEALAGEEVRAVIAPLLRKIAGPVVAVLALLLWSLASGCAPAEPVPARTEVAVLFDASGSQTACAPECDTNPLPHVWEVIAEETRLRRGLTFEVRQITDGLGSVLLYRTAAPEKWQQGESVTRQKAAYRAQVGADLAAVTPDPTRAGSDVLGALWSTARDLAESGAEESWLVIVSDLRAAYPSDRPGHAPRWYFGGHSLPSAVEVITQATKDGRLPDLSGITRVVACNVHRSPEAGSTWSARQHTALLDLWTQLFLEMGATDARLLASCQNIAAHNNTNTKGSDK
ncbi:MAG: hypothetical protein ACOZNI_25185 [Myxococcota bacterium]